MAASLFKLVGDIYVNNEDANKSIQKTDDKASKLGQTLLKGTQTVAKWGAAIATGATAAVAGMMKVATSAAETADEIDKASKRMDISTDSYQELKYAAEQCGVEMGTLEKAAKKLEGTDMNLDDAIAEIMSLGTETERSEKAAELFGDNIAYTLSPILAESGESFGDLRDRAHDLGIVMSKENVDAGVKLGDTMSDVKKAFGGLVTQLGTALIPIVQTIADLILDNMPMIQSLFDELAPVLTDLLQTIAPILWDVGMQILPPILDLVKALLPIFADLVKTILPPIADVLAQILPILTDIISTILPPLMDLLKPVLDIVLTLLQPLLDLLDLALTPIKIILSPIKLALEGLKDIFEALKAPIDAVVSAMQRLEFPNIKVPEWAKKLLGIEDEGEIQGHTDNAGRVGDFINNGGNPTPKTTYKPYTNVPTYGSTPRGGSNFASGGFPDSGQVFVARENGLPEMIGRFGNQTAVANNEQIIQGIAQGVASALAPVEDILMQIYNNGLQIDGEKVSKVLAPSMNYYLGTVKG